MSGLRLLLGKELLEQVRTLRLFIVLIVFALFGLISPLTAKYLPDILKAVGGAEIVLPSLPTPSVADAVDQFLKNLNQFGVLAAILLAMGTVATEKDRGTAALLMTKPVARPAFLLAKFVAIGLNLLLAVAVAGALAYYYTLVLFEAPPAGGWAAMCLLLWLSIYAYAALTLLGSTLAGSAAGGAGLGIAFLVVTLILSALPRIGDLMPPALIGPARALAIGVPPGDLAGPVVATVLIVVAAYVLSVLAFRDEEL